MRCPVPQPLHGERLEQELHNAGFPAATVVVIGDEVEIRNADETAAQVVEAHTGEPWPHQVNADTLRARALKALEDNRAYLAKAAPANSEIALQIKALTKQNTAIIRLLLNELNGTD